MWVAGGGEAAGALVSINIPALAPVPVTMQVVGMTLAGLVLSPHAAFLAMAAYLAVGLAGLPVFAGARSGPGVLVGPTGGFLLAMPAAAAFTSWTGRRLGRRPGAAWWAAVASLPLLYAGGTLQLAAVSRVPPAAAAALVLAFFPLDLGKAVLAAAVARALDRAGVAR